MYLLKKTIEKIVLIIITISILITFLATPSSYAKLELGEDEFYYAGTTKGQYTVKEGIFEWLLNHIGDIADWILGLITLGVRMVFIGWTALLEKTLTWALESTAGVSVDGTPVVSSTDLTSLGDSSNNVTIEAIVYNQVPALSINFFDLDYDRAVSGTGQKLICSKCKKPVDECVVNKQCLKKGDTDAEGNTVEEGCDCNGSCDACKAYIAQLDIDEPIFIKLRQMVAVWYNIIRLIAVAAMLVVLIAVGLKMALSTISQDKALYKRMLVDWVVGMIIIFTLHYFMVFIIYINEVFVNVIRESANSVNHVRMMEATGTESSSELEIKVYEEIRTRAYDPKLINGMTGMIMYMTLVFFAFKYTLIYLKRYLTVLVLTLMAPGVGVAYALQKAISGKSKVLKTWMTEYMMNVIIQIVHALMYAIFISQALFLSLQNIAGIIIALILMNYMSKADGLFKKIFRFNGNLLGHTENAMESAKQNFDTLKNLRKAQGVKAVAGVLTNTPYAKVLKGVGKAGLAAGVGGARLGVAAAQGLADTIREHRPSEEERASRKHEKAVEKEMDKNGLGYEQRENESEEQYEARRSKAEEKVTEKENSKRSTKRKQTKEEDDEILATGGRALKENMDKAKETLDKAGENATPEMVQDYTDAARKYNRWEQLLTPTNMQIAKAHVTRLVSMENVFTTTAFQGKPNSKFAQKHPHLSSAGRGMRNAKTAVFGTTHWDRKNWKFTNDGNGIYSQFSAKNLLGLSDEDKKQLKGLGKDLGMGLAGMGSLFFGMGTIVANPKVGMGLLAAGVAGTNKVFGRNTDIASYKGKYKFSRFSAQSIRTIRNSALARAQYEHNAILVADINSRHPGFSQRLKNGAISAATLGVATGIGSASVVPVAMFGVAGYMATHFRRNTALGAKLNEIDKHHTREQKQKIEEFFEESEEQEMIAILSDMEARNILREKANEKKQSEYEIEEIEKLGFEIDTQTGDIRKPSDTPRDKTQDESEIKDKVGNKEITQADVDLVHKEIDQIVSEMAKGGDIDIQSKKIQSEATKKLTQRLQKKGVISEGQNVEELFKDGKTGLVNEIKNKAEAINEANGRKVSSEEAEKIKKKANNSAKKRVQQEDKSRKKELSEVISMMVGNEQVSDEPSQPTRKSSDEVLADLLSQKGTESATITNGEKTYSLSKEETDYVTGTVKNLLELKELNKESLKRRVGDDDIKGATIGYLEARADKSSLTIEMAKLQQEEISLQGKNEKDMLAGDGITVKEKRERIRAKMETAERKLRQTQDGLQVRGPVIDVGDLIKDNGIFNLK